MGVLKCCASMHPERYAGWIRCANCRDHCLIFYSEEEIRSSLLHQICKNAPTSQVAALAVVGNETIRECHEDVRWTERVTRDLRVSDEDA